MTTLCCWQTNHKNQLFLQKKVNGLLFLKLQICTDALILTAGDNFQFPLFRKLLNAEITIAKQNTAVDDVAVVVVAIPHLMSKHHFGTQHCDHRKAEEKPTRNKSLFLLSTWSHLELLNDWREKTTSNEAPVAGCEKTADVVEKYFQLVELSEAQTRARVRRASKMRLPTPPLSLSYPLSLDHYFPI